MKEKTLCTVITFNFLAYAQALHFSVNRHRETQLCALITDKIEADLTDEDKDQVKVLPETIRLYYLDQLQHLNLAKDLSAKYGLSDMDCLRWSLKPVFIQFLIHNEKYKRILYCDSDLFFFEDPIFLFNELDTFNILLTPHWRSSDPKKDQENFDQLFVAGIFNAGFIGANQFAADAMEWWAKACLHQCVKNFSIGQFVDQTYLNLFPVLFEKVHILKHKGCNVANWNQVDCPRSVSNGNVMIDQLWPVVFIHFTKSTIQGIQSGVDFSLTPFLQRYVDVLQTFGVDLAAAKPPEQEKTGLGVKSLTSRIIKKIKRETR